MSAPACGLARFFAALPACLPALWLGAQLAIGYLAVPVLFAQMPKAGMADAALREMPDEALDERLKAIADMVSREIQD